MATDIPFPYHQGKSTLIARVHDDGDVTIVDEAVFSCFEGDIISRGVQADDAIALGLALIQAGTLAKLKGTADEAGEPDGP